MAIFTVTTRLDTVNPNDGVLSLREAVQAANATAGADAITFAAGLEGATLRLTRGELAVASDVVVTGDPDGDGVGVTLDQTSDGQQARDARVILVGGAGSDVTLSGLTVRGGWLGGEDDGAGIRVAEGGNALTLVRCAVANNVITGIEADPSPGNGAGIAVGEGGSLRVVQSEIRGNVIGIYGPFMGAGTGAGIVGRGAEVRVEDSLIAGNSAPYGSGGGITVVGGTLLVERSAVVGNNVYGRESGGGGGIAAFDATATVTASTIANNQGYWGGGVLLGGSTYVRLDGCTVTGNAVPYRGWSFGGGIATSAPGSGDLPRLHLANTLVVGNWFGGPTEPNGSLDDISGYGRVTSNGHNVFSSDVPGNVPGDIEGFDPARVFAALDPLTGGGALALNGGLTPTAALLDAAANRALGGAEPVTAGAVDQRGAARPLPGDGGPDIGAFELDERAVSTAPTIFNDRLTGSAAADALAGRLGNDHLRGLAGADTLRGDEGGDTLVGGPGGDLLDGSSGLDTASYRDAAGAVDADLAAGRASGALGNDRLLAIENLAGGGFADRLAGDELANALGGGRGDDRLLGRGGADELEGNAGRDLLHGGGGRDALAGGAGADLFDYDAPAESPWRADRTLGDRIADFAHLTDEIDLTTIDARSATPAVNEAFAFLTVEGAAFTGAGQVRWYRDGGATFVEANSGGSLQAELLIRLDGLTTLSATDFVL